MGTAPDRQEVVALLATYGNREPEQVHERIDSLDLVWLLHQVEQRYGVSLDLTDEALARMSTVTGAVDVLRDAMATARGRSEAEPEVERPGLGGKAGATHE